MNKLLKLAKKLDKFAICAEGNVSQKIKNGFYIKASGKSLASLTKKDLVLCDFDGLEREKNRKASMEKYLHAFLFKNLNINFIVHTHPKNTLKILCSASAEEFASNRLFPDQVVYNGIKSCLVNYSNPGLDLAKNIEIALHKFLTENKKYPKLILLKNHGIICFGNTIEECLISTEICEKSAEIFIGAKSLDNIQYLKSYEIEKIENDINQKYRQNLIK